MWLARFGCWRRPLYRLMAAGCGSLHRGNSSNPFRDLVGFGLLREGIEMSVCGGCTNILPCRGAHVQSISTLPEQAEVSKSLCTHNNSEKLIKNRSEVLVKNVGLTVGNTKLLAKKIKEALEENKEGIHKDRLKKRFNSLLRPILAPRLLLLPEALSSPSTKFLHNQHHIRTDKAPYYLSASEITMHEEITKDPEEWNKFINQVISLRVFVVEDWESNIGNIEKCYYFYGVHGAGSSEFYKGEIDASFHDGADGCPGKATISVVLWKGKEIIYAEVFKDLDCHTVQAAEACAALALCFKCIELGILDLLLWTDSTDIHGAISGSLTLRADRVDRDLLLLLRHIGTKFRSLISMCKRREQLFLVDDIAQSYGKSNNLMMLQDLVDKWDYELRGKASFRISQASSANQIIKNFSVKNKKNGADIIGPYTRKAQTKCFLEVNNNSKLDVVRILKETLRPSVVCFAVSKHEERSSDFLSQLATIAGDTLASKADIGDWSLLKYGDTDTKQLLIVLDPTIPEEHYNLVGVFTIILADPEERKNLDPSIEEASALTYAYFNGVLTAHDVKKKQNKGGKSNGMQGPHTHGVKKKQNKGGKSNGMQGPHTHGVKKKENKGGKSNGMQGPHKGKGRTK